MAQLVSRIPRAWRRVGLAGVFALALASFFLPWVEVAVDPRFGNATGFQLFPGEPSFRGEYVHLAYEGSIERLLENGQGGAAVALAASVLGLLVSFIQGRAAFAASAVMAAIALLGMWGVQRGTATLFNPPDTDLRYGFWLALTFLLAAGVGAIAFFRAEKWDLDAEDDEDVSPWRYPRVSRDRG